MRKVAIVGAGMTAFGEHFALGIKDLLPMAFAECAASVDKGLAKTDLQAAWFGALGTTDGFPSGILADTLGLPDLPVTRVENSCATGNDAVRNALFAVASGAFDIALVMGADKLRETASKDMLWAWEGTARDMAWTTRSAWLPPPVSPCTCGATCTSRPPPGNTWRWWR